MKTIDIKYKKSSKRKVKLPETIEEADKVLMSDDLVDILVKNSEYDKELPDVVLKSIKGKRKGDAAKAEPKAQAASEAKGKPQVKAPKK